MADGAGSPPPEVAHVLDWFAELAARRTSGMAPNPITYPDLEAWARLTGRRPTPYEVRLLTRLDDAVLERAAKKAEAEPPAGEGPEAVKAIMMTAGPRKRAKKPKPT